MLERNQPGYLNPHTAPGLLNPIGASHRGPELQGAGSFLFLPGVAGNYASTPDSAAVSITGDIDIRVKVALDDWTPTTSPGVFSKYSTFGATRSFLFRVMSDGRFHLITSPNGTDIIAAQSTVAPSITDGVVKWIRVTCDVDNGAAGNTTKFYVSDDGESWSQVGTDVVNAGTTSIHDNATRVDIGGWDNQSIPAGKVYYAELRNGIDGPVVAKFDPVGKIGGITSWTASTGEVWTINRSGANFARLM